VSIKRLTRILPGHKRTMDDDGISADQKIAEIFDQIYEEAGHITDKETRDTWMDALQTFAKSGDIGQLLAAAEWRRKVAPLDEFLFSSAYLGMDEDRIFPGVITALYDLDTDQFDEAILKGCIGSGKSYIANLKIARDIYKLSCMRHPQSTFGIQSKSSIVFTIQSVRLATAKKAVFQEFGAYINDSPYFKKVFPYDPKVQSQMIFREFNVSLLPVSSAPSGAISMNVIGGILDEMNFMQKIERSKSGNAELDGSFDQAKLLYDNLSRRRKSRFLRRGTLPGTLLLVSSSRYPDDFTEKKAKESIFNGGSNSRLYVYSESQWSAKGRKQFLPEDFYVQVGNHKTRSRIVTIDEPIAPGATRIAVPMDFYEDFERDIDGSIRDIAGITVLSTNPFMSRRDTIESCVTIAMENGYENPFNVEEVDLTNGIPVPVRERLRTDVDMFRTCHIDLAVTGDACGFAVGHIAGTKVIRRNKSSDDGENMTELEVLPVIAIDVAMRIKAPAGGGEIDFSLVRQFVIMLRDRFGLDIKYVTFDGFNSVDSRQILRKQGFQTDYLSVEKIEPYRALRDGIYDGRILLPQHTYLQKELASLEVRVHNNKEKVDHPPSGSKDVADAVCGVTSFLLQRRSAWSNLSVGRGEGLYLFNPRRHLRIAKSGNDDEVEIVRSLRPSPVRRRIIRHVPKRQSFDKKSAIQ